MDVLDIPIIENDNQEANAESIEESKNDSLTEELKEIKDNITYLKDLFVRRLNDDKQKAAVIQKLCEAASYSFVEPFLYDIILLLDRIEKQDDDFSKSVYEELLGIIERRGVSIIPVTEQFDPAKNKVVRVNEVPDMEGTKVSGVIRNGYAFSGKVIRPIEVILDKGVKKADEDNTADDSE